MSTLRTADDFVEGWTTGNSTSIEIAAAPADVWRALHALAFADLRFTGLLMTARSLPSRLLRRGALAGHGPSTTPVLDTMVANRFVRLHEEAEVIVTIGVVGQFWKLAGGDDAAVADRDAFLAFDEPGFVKSAIDFSLEPAGAGTRLTTTTCNRATDAHAARLFGRYWRIIGPGSKAIRVDMLRSVRRSAE